MTVSAPDPHDAAWLGNEIRELRKARGLTLDEVSGRIDCSTAYLSRIERGSARVSAQLLGQIGRVLDVDPSWFFPRRSGAGPMERNHIVRAENRRRLSDLYTRSFDELGFSDELLSSTLTGACYMMLSRFPPNGGPPDWPTPPDGYQFEGEQHGLVVSGEVDLLLDGEVIALKAGDSFSYPSNITHRMRNRTNAEAVVVWAMSPVRISW